MKKLKENNLVLVMIYKAIIYLCWFAFGLAFKLFLTGKITDHRVFLLCISLMVIYVIRDTFIHLYRNIAEETYHDIEVKSITKMYQKISNLSYEYIENNNMNELKDKCLGAIYRYNKFIYDLGEYIIPSILGIILIFIVCVRMNVFICFIITILFGLVLYYRFTHLEKVDVSKLIKNDLLSELIVKTKMVKLLNKKDYFIKKLEDNKERKLVLHQDDLEIDLKFNNLFLAVLGLLLISVLVCVKGPFNKIGYIIFYILMSLKLQRLVGVGSLALYNLYRWNEENITLENIFSNAGDNNYLNSFKSIKINDGIIQYPSGIIIKMPSFEVTNNDTISIMGKSGEGKSTILNIIAGTYKINQGELLIDNKKDSLVNMYYLSKDNDMLHLSLYDNLCLNKEITEDEVMTYLKDANLIDYINSLENGFKTTLNEIQDDSILVRLSLIRGIINGYDHFLLDFGSYNLDLEAEKILTNLIKKYLKKKTIIMVTHSSVLNNTCRKHYFIKNHTLLQSETLL